MPEPSRGALLWRRIGLGAGVAAFLTLAFIPSGLHRIEGVGHRPAYAAATAALMSVWWLSEALPIHWTACAPIVLYPLFGVFGRGPLVDSGKSVEPFVDAYIFLFMGGMIIGAAMEQWNLHRRVALHIMRAVGTDPKRLLLGMLVATAAISLWISNTATAVMMLPIGMALLAQLESASGGRKLWHFGTAIMLAVAYASNVGGIGSKIGTGTNSIFCGLALKHLGRDIGFMEYMAAALPFVVLFIPLVWLVLWRVARRDDLGSAQGRDVLDRELAAMGSMSRGEKRVAAVFLGAALLWILGDPLRKRAGPLVPEFWPGFKFEGKHYEAWVAMGAALVLVAFRAVSWSSVRRIPWSTLVLLGGSFAMAEGIRGSGLSQWMAERMGGLAGLPGFWQIFLASLATVGLSAVASNTGTVSVLLNVLPRSLPVFWAASIGASCDFMLPAGTPPNAIVFGSGYIRLPTMMRTGFALDLAAVAAITLYTFFYVRFVLSLFA
jgi:sodium-dependent dicarboxylate transporter 2/3/5